jgi:two-component system OmpR family response regulator/two-component system alkaline phosphatase synthesis response regulator PhoP
MAGPRSNTGLPRIVMMTARFETVESVVKWFRQAGYPIVWLPVEANGTFQRDIPPSDVTLFHTVRPKTEVHAVLDALHRRHKKKQPALIVLTSREGIGDLDVTSGIDDVACAPYDPQEIETRIKFALWRRFGVQIQDMIVCGDLMINLGNYEVAIRGEPVDLTLKEYELLKYLAKHRGRVFTRDELLTAVWGYNYFGGTRTVDVHVRRLRMKIERHGVQIITTVRGVGYKFGD